MSCKVTLKSLGNSKSLYKILGIAEDTEVDINEVVDKVIDNLVSSIAERDVYFKLAEGSVEKIFKIETDLSIGQEISYNGEDYTVKNIQDNRYTLSKQTNGEEEVIVVSNRTKLIKGLKRQTIESSEFTTVLKEELANFKKYKTQELKNRATQKGDGFVVEIFKTFKREHLDLIKSKLEKYPTYKGVAKQSFENGLFKSLELLNEILKDSEYNEFHSEARDLTNQIINIVNPNKIKFTFPSYIQTLYNSVPNETTGNNLYLLKSYIKGTVEDPSEREFTEAIIDELESSKTNYGYATPELIDGRVVYQLYSVNFDSGRVVTPVLHRNGGTDFMFNEVYKPTTNPDTKKEITPEQWVNYTDIESILDPRHAGYSDEEIIEPIVELSKDVSVVSNMFLMTAIKSLKDKVDSNFKYSTFPVFMAGRDKFLGTTQNKQVLVDGKITLKPYKVERIITKGLNTKIDLPVYTNERYVGELDTLNYYYVTENSITPVPILDFNDSELEDFLSDFLIQPNIINRYGNVQTPVDTTIPYSIAKELYPDAAIKLFKSFKDKIFLIKELQNRYDNGERNVLLSELAELKAQTEVRSIAKSVTNNRLQGIPMDGDIPLNQWNYNKGGIERKVQVYGLEGNETNMIFNIDGVSYIYNSNTQDSLEPFVKEIVLEFESRKAKNELDRIDLGKTKDKDSNYKPGDRSSLGQGFKTYIINESDFTEAYIGVSKMSKEDIDLLASNTAIKEQIENYINELKLKGIDEEQIESEYTNNIIFNRLGTDIDSKFTLLPSFKIDYTYVDDVTKEVVKDVFLIPTKPAFNNEVVFRGFSSKKTPLSLGTDNKLFGIEVPQSKISNLTSDDIRQSIVNGSVKVAEAYLNGQDASMLQSLKDTDLTPILRLLTITDGKIKVTQPFRAAYKKLLEEVLSAYSFNSTIFYNVTPRILKQDTDNKDYSKLSHNIDGIDRYLRFKINQETKVEISSEESVMEVAPTIDITEDDIKNLFEDDDDYKVSGEGVFKNDRPITQSDIEEVKRIVGGEVRDLNSIIDRLGKLKNKVLGARKDNLIYLDELTKTSGLLYHEAAHIAFDFFTQIEQEIALSEMKERLVYSEQDVKDFGANRFSTLPYNLLEDLFLKEKFMDYFAQYKLDKNNRSWLSKVGAVIKDLFDSLLDFIGFAKKNQLGSLMKLIDSGKLKNRTALSNQEYDFAVLTVKTEVRDPSSNGITSDNFREKTFKSDSKEIDNIVYQIWGTLLEPVNKPILDKYIEAYNDKSGTSYKSDILKGKILRMILDKTNDFTIKTLSDRGVYNQVLTEEEKQFIDSNIGRNLELLEANGTPEVFKSIFKYFKGKTPEIRNNIDNVLIPYIDSFIKDISIQDEEITSEEIDSPEGKEMLAEGEKTQDKSAYNVDPTLFGGDVQEFFRRVVFATNSNNYTVYSTINTKAVIEKLMKFCSSVPMTNKYDEFITNLENLAKFDLDLYYVHKEFIKQFDITTSTVDNKQVVSINKNQRLYDKLVNKLVLTQMNYSSVISYSDKKVRDKGFYDGLQMEDAFDNKNKLLLDKSAGKLFRPERKFSKVFIAGDYLYTNGSIKSENAVYYRVPLDIDIPVATYIARNRQSARVTEGIMKQAFKAITPESNKNADYVNSAVNYLNSLYLSYLKAPANLKPYYIQSYYAAVGINISTVYAVQIDKDGFKTKEILEKEFKSHTKFGTANQGKIQNYVLTKDVSSELFRAYLYGTDTSSITIKDSKGDFRYALSKDNIMQMFNKSTDKGFLTNNVFVALDFKEKGTTDFNDLDNTARLKFLIANYKSNLFNVGQLEGNKTNFSIRFAPLSPEERVQRRLEPIDKNLASIKRHIGLIRELEQAYLDGNLKSVLDSHNLEPKILKLTEDDFTENGVNPNIWSQRAFRLFFDYVDVKFNVDGQYKEWSKMSPIERIDALESGATYSKSLANMELSKLIKAFVEDSLDTLDPRDATGTRSVLDDSDIDKNRRETLSNFFIDNLIRQFDIYSTVYGNEYYYAFKNNSDDFVKRAKSLAIQGEPVRRHNMVIVKDDAGFILYDKTGKFGHRDYKFYTTIGQAKKDYPNLKVEGRKIIETDEYSVQEVEEATDGQAYSTLEHKFDFIQDKGRMSEYTEAYYTYLITDGSLTVYQDKLIEVKDAPAGYLQLLLKDSIKNKYINGVLKGATGTNVDFQGFHNQRYVYAKQSEYSHSREMYMRPKTEVPTLLWRQVMEVSKVIRTLERNQLLSDDKNYVSNSLKNFYNQRANLYTQIYDKYEPVKGQEQMFNKYKAMETNNIQMLVHTSGSKTLGSVSTLDNIKAIDIPYGGKKHQTEVTNNKGKSPLSTQMQEYISQDLANSDVVYRGKKLPMKEVAKEFERVISNLVEYKSSVLLSQIDDNGKLRESFISSILEDGVDATRSADYIKDFFRIEGDKFVVPLDFPTSLKPFLSSVVSLMNNVIKQKLHGEGYTLLASTAYTVRLDSSGNIIPLDSSQEVISTRPLQAYTEVFTNGKWEKITSNTKLTKDSSIREVHEAVIPAAESWMKEYVKDRKTFTQEQLDAKYDSELFYSIGTRIPCENKRSMSVIKFVDFVSEMNGSIMITTVQMMKQTGHDHDADKSMVQSFHAFKDEEYIPTKGNMVELPEPTTRWVVKNTPDDRLDYLQDKSEFSKQIKRELSQNKEFKNLNDQIYNIESKSYVYNGQEYLFEELMKVDKGLVNKLRYLEKNWKMSKGSLKFEDIMIKEKDSAKEKEFITEILNNGEFVKDYIKRFDLINDRTKLKKEILALRIELLDTKKKELESFDTLQNKYLQAQIALLSNNHTLDTGLLREQTDLQLYEDWTKLERAKGGGNILNKHLSIKRLLTDIQDSTNGKALVGINAKSVKSRVALDEMGVKFNYYFDGIKLDNVGSKKGTDLTKINDLESRFWTNKKLDLISKGKSNPKIEQMFEDYKQAALDRKHYFTSQVSAISISVATDQIKNDFGYGLNLNDSTGKFYFMAAVLGIPTPIALQIGTSDLVRDKDLKKLKLERDRLKIGLNFTEKGKPLRDNGAPAYINLNDLFSEEPISQYLVLDLMLNMISDYDNTGVFNPLYRLNKGIGSIGEYFQTVAMMQSNIKQDKDTFTFEENLGLSDLDGLNKKPDVRLELENVKGYTKNNAFMKYVGKMNPLLLQMMPFVKAMNNVTKLLDIEKFNEDNLEIISNAYYGAKANQYIQQTTNKVTLISSLVNHIKHLKETYPDNKFLGSLYINGNPNDTNELGNKMITYSGSRFVQAAEIMEDLDAIYLDTQTEVGNVKEILENLILSHMALFTGEPDSKSLVKFANPTMISNILRKIDSVVQTTEFTEDNFNIDTLAKLGGSNLGLPYKEVELTKSEYGNYFYIREADTTKLEGLEYFRNGNTNYKIVSDEFIGMLAVPISSTQFSDTLSNVNLTNGERANLSRKDKEDGYNNELKSGWFVSGQLLASETPLEENMVHKFTNDSSKTILVGKKVNDDTVPINGKDYFLYQIFGKDITNGGRIIQKNDVAVLKNGNESIEVRIEYLIDNLELYKKLDYVLESQEQDKSFIESLELTKVTANVIKPEVLIKSDYEKQLEQVESYAKKESFNLIQERQRDPQSINDFLANEFKSGVRIKTDSFKRFGDSNWVKEKALHFLKKDGFALDVYVESLSNNERVPFKFEEQDVIDFIMDNKSVSDYWIKTQNNLRDNIIQSDLETLNRELPGLGECKI